MRRRRGRPMLSATFSDDSGWAELLWFQQAGYFAKKLKDGALLARPRPRRDRRRAAAGRSSIPRSKRSTRTGPTGTAARGSVARILPVYQKPGEMPVAAMRRIVARCGRSTPPASRERWSRAEVRKRLRLVPLADALRRRARAAGRRRRRCARGVRDAGAPQPDLRGALRAAGRHDDCARLERKQQPGLAMRPCRRAPAKSSFARCRSKPTGAQRRVIAEIGGDMAAPQPMNRLVQGDVGSGKTVVAFAAALQAIAAGYQAAVMAPTELLAEQHLRDHARLGPRPRSIDIALLTGGVQGGGGARRARGDRAGDIDLVVGTHALDPGGDGVRAARPRRSSTSSIASASCSARPSDAPSVRRRKGARRHAAADGDADPAHARR